MVIAVPLAVKKSQKVVTVQDKAANYAQIGQDCNLDKEIYCADGLFCNPADHKCTRRGNQPNGTTPSPVPCWQILALKTTYCTGGIGQTTPGFVPCARIDEMITQFCSTTTPTRAPTPTLTPTSTPRPITCVWCGNLCINSQIKRACTAQLPPAGASCVAVKDQCQIVYNTKPTPTAAKCSVGQVKMIGKLRFVCVKENWQYQP